MEKGVASDGGSGKARGLTRLENRETCGTGRGRAGNLTWHPQVMEIKIPAPSAPLRAGSVAKDATRTGHLRPLT